jgi:hypothetical protein
MKWYDNKFHPNQILTKAEALTVLVRMQSWLLDETQTPRRKNYYDQAFEVNLTKETDESKITLPITRYEAALLLNRQYGAPNLEEIWNGEEEISAVIENLLEQENELKESLRSNYLRTE